jgi:phage gp29-like protein
MAKKKFPENQLKKLPEADFADLSQAVLNEAAGIWTDYIRQYVGVISGNGFNVQGQRAIYMNQDRVQRWQTYQELAFYDLYAEVQRDPHVSAVLTSAKINVAGMKYDIDAYKPNKKEKASPRDESIADFVRMALKKTGYFPQHMYNLMDAVGMGFSVSEVIWEMTDEGVLIKDILNRPQRRFQFDAVDRSLRLRNLDAPYYGIPLPDKKFITFSTSGQWSNPFGDPMCQNIYWMWLFKKTVLKFWMQHLQTGAASVPIVQHPTGADATLKAEALSIAQQIRNGSYGRIPANFEIQWAESKNAMLSAEAYSAFIRFCNDEISKCINGQTLTTEASAGNNKGSFATSKVHQLSQSARDEALASTMNATVIKWLVDFNFDKVEGYPEFRFDLEEPDDLKTEAEIIKSLSEAGYNFDETELSEKFNYKITKKEALNLIPKLDKDGNPIKDNPFDKKDVEEPIEEKLNK